MTPLNTRNLRNEENHRRRIPFQLQGFNVIALNVIKLRVDNIDPKKYQDRVTKWRAEVENGGGNWSIINDLENLDQIFAN